MSIKQSTDQEMLFEKTYPTLSETEEWNKTEKLQNEFSAIGFYISSHPISQYEDILKQCHFPSIAEAKDLTKAKVVVIINGFTLKTTKSQTKLCILQISDPSGIFEASMFSETFGVCRDLIHTGNIVTADITCYQNDDQTRIVINKMQKFDLADAKQTSVGTSPSVDIKNNAGKSFAEQKKLQIRVSNKRELALIKDLIDNFRKNGNHSIELFIPENKKFLLPQKYFLTSYDILDLRNIVGVRNIVETTKK
jgi:DNA polymerase III alpha subunit